MGNRILGRFTCFNAGRTSRLSYPTDFLIFGNPKDEIQLQAYLEKQRVSFILRKALQQRKRRNNPK